MQKCTVLLTSDELQIVAAASGLKQALLFQSAEAFDRTRQIQAICRMLRDNLLIQNKDSIAVGPSLLPFTDVLRHTKFATVALPNETDIPSLCIYYDKITQEFVVISPHESKNGSYKMYLANGGMIMSELEELRLLPVPYGNGLTGDDIGELLSDPSTGILAEERFVTQFKRSCLADKSEAGYLTVFRASPTWIMAEGNSSGERISYYRRDIFADWLKGI